MEKKLITKKVDGKKVLDSTVFCPTCFDALEVYAVIDRERQRTHFEYHCFGCDVDYQIIPVIKTKKEIVVKNIIRKIVKATTKFISSDITREEREKIYDECAEQIKNPPIK